MNMLLSVLCLMAVLGTNAQPLNVCKEIEYIEPTIDFWASISRDNIPAIPVFRKNCCPGFERRSKDSEVLDCVPICNHGCPVHSYCAKPNSCQCNMGYKMMRDYERGDVCVPICEPECSENYNCVEPNICKPYYQCKYGYGTSPEECGNMTSSTETTLSDESTSTSSENPATTEVQDSTTILSDEFTSTSSENPTAKEQDSTTILSDESTSTSSENPTAKEQDSTTVLSDESTSTSSEIPTAKEQDSTTVLSDDSTSTSSASPVIIEKDSTSTNEELYFSSHWLYFKSRGKANNLTMSRMVGIHDEYEYNTFI